MKLNIIVNYLRNYGERMNRYSSLVSIIVPIYNVEKYLKRCLDSILSQSYKNIEIILIDDGSKDNSGLICDNYAAIDKRVKVIHQKNSGVSVARNVGLAHSKGEYIAFVDSDDYISQSFVEKSILNMLENKSDIIIFNFIEDHGNKTVKRPLKIENCRDYKDFLVGILWDHIPSYPWNKFYKRYLWDNVKYPENMNFEDLAIMPEIFLKANNICYIDEYLYYYNCCNNNSITNRISSKNKYGMFISFYNRCKIVESMKLNNIKEYCMCRSVKSAVTAYGLNTYDEELLDEQIKILREYLKNIDISKLKIGIKYKILYYSIFKDSILCRIYGYFMYLLQNIKFLGKHIYKRE